MKKYTIFFTLLISALTIKAQESKPPKHLIKFAYTNMLNGEFPVYYERVFHDKWSLELGVGTTKWFPVLVGSMLCSNTFQGYTIERSKVGFFMSPSVRFYPLGSAKGFHFSAGTQYKQFNYKVVAEENTIRKAKQKDLDRLRLGAGYIAHWGAWNGEFQVGGAYRTTTITPQKDNIEGYPFENTDQNTRVSLYLNCKIGLSF